MYKSGKCKIHEYYINENIEDRTIKKNNRVDNKQGKGGIRRKLYYKNNNQKSLIGKSICRKI